MSEHLALSPTENVSSRWKESTFWDLLACIKTLLLCLNPQQVQKSKTFGHNGTHTKAEENSESQLDWSLFQVLQSERQGVHPAQSPLCVSPICRKANIERQTTIHTHLHTYSPFRILFFHTDMGENMQNPNRKKRYILSAIHNQFFNIGSPIAWLVMGHGTSLVFMLTSQSCLLLLVPQPECILM